jgi:SAM-dependent methyltransferase
MSVSDNNYVLGQTGQERERLLLQARILRPFTERYFRAAGIGPGMRVLDVGSGIGDVALLAGDIVGPGGRVIGLDRDAAALARARRRADEQGCSSWVSFQTTTIENYSTTKQFDAVVGRYILLYQPDAAATIRELMRFLKPGGIVAFHELVFGLAGTFPPCELWDQIAALVGEVFRRGGAPPDFGHRLGPTFIDAGLPFPTIVAEAVMGGGPGSAVFPWLAATMVNTAPRMKEFGLAPPDGIALDHTLSDKLEEAAVALGCQVQGPMQYGAWSRKPV